MKRFRKSVDRIGLALPLPNINPNIVSGLSIITSMLFVISFNFSFEIAFLLLFFTLLLDWFDGLIAKKHSRLSEEGYLVDLMSDRLSEGIMFSVFFFPWFYIFSFNCLLSLFSVLKKKHIIIPVRHFFLVFYAFLLFSLHI